MRISPEYKKKTQVEWDRKSFFIDLAIKAAKLVFRAILKEILDDKFVNNCQPVRKVFMALILKAWKINLQTYAKRKYRVQTENIFPIIKKFLYSDHEIFISELVSNAVDATQKLKTLSSIG